MNDKEKLVRLQALLAQWRIQRDRFAELSETRPNDLTVTQYVLYASHVTELEEILSD